MRIYWTKGREKQDTLTCIRDDGSRFFTPLTPFFVPHDLLHYAVETTFGFRHAFWGLIASGWSVDDFSAKDTATGKVANPVPAEAMIAENMVCFLTSVETGSLSSDPAAVCDLLMQYLSDTEIPIPASLTPQNIAEVRTRFAVLKERWEAVSPGDTLELVFP